MVGLLGGGMRDEGVASRVVGLLGGDSQYLRSLRAGGLRFAQRRGLLNSSIAAGAGEDAAVRGVLPVAEAEARLAADANRLAAQLENQRFLSGQEIAARERLQAAELAAVSDRLDRELASRERLQAEELGAARERLGLELGSRERLQAFELEAVRGRLERELGSREALQRAELLAAKERLGMQLDSEERRFLGEFQNRIILQRMELDAARENLGRQLESRERVEALDRESRERVAALEAAMRERIARMEVVGQDRERALTAAMQMARTWGDKAVELMTAEKIPAAARERFLQMLQVQYDSNMALLEQIMGIDLAWVSPGGQLMTGLSGLGPGFGVEGFGG